MASKHVGTLADKTALDSFTPAQSMRAGAGAGAVLGLVLGTTFWTHHLDAAAALIAVMIVLCCALVGLGLGRLVAALGD